ncbi:hypothetical protein EMIT0194MI4_40106 [Pseudomonas sp. IT-194MI4]
MEPLRDANSNNRRAKQVVDIITIAAPRRRGNSSDHCLCHFIGYSAETV